jgi:hypothetical protein
LCTFLFRRERSRKKGKVRLKSGVLLPDFVKCFAWRFTPTVSERSKSIFRSDIIFDVSTVLVFFVISERA